jgi:hypothetical protein
MSRSLWLAALVAVVVAGVWLHPKTHAFLVSHVENNIGALYATGALGADGIPKSLDWYRDAAALHSGTAAFNLGYAYQAGLGTAVDEHEAMRWYEQAAEEGVAMAANNLAMLYANPAAGRPRLALARLWMLRARKLDDGTLKSTIDSSLAAMEHDMTPRELAASDDPARAARLDAPALPPAPAHLTDAEIHQQVVDGYAAAAPLRQAIDEYIAAHHALPSADDVAKDARLDPAATPRFRVALGTGAMVRITLRGGPYDGEELGWIPLLRQRQLSWVCSRGHVPPRYFGNSCP